jgi:hypothetical protein
MPARPPRLPGSCRPTLRTAATSGTLLLALALAATRVAGQLRGAAPPPPSAPTIGVPPPGAPATGRPPADYRATRPDDEPVPPTRAAPGERPTDTVRPRGDWDEPVRRAPAPIPPARPLPDYPPEPPPTAPPSSAVLPPPDFVGSAAGRLEIPVGQTATLLARDCREATLQDPRIARVLSRETDRVLIRGLFPGRTLLELRLADRDAVYLVQVR